MHHKLRVQDAYFNHVRLNGSHSAGILPASIPENMDATYAGSDNDGVALYGGTQAKRQLNVADGKAYFNFGGDSPLRIKGPPSTGPHLVDVAATVEIPFKRSFKTHVDGSPSGNGRLTLNIDPCANGVRKDSTCVPCPAKTIRKFVRGIVKCICDPGKIFPDGIIGYFNASASSPSAKCEDGEKFCCAPCPAGADCTPLGFRTVETLFQRRFDEETQTEEFEVTLNITEQERSEDRLNIKQEELPKNSLKIHDLTPRPGFWRLDPSSDAFASCADPISGISEQMASQLCCPVPDDQTSSICKIATQNENSTKAGACQSGHSGPKCGVCDRENGFVKWGGACQICEALNERKPSKLPSLVSSLVLSLVVYAVFVVRYLRISPNKKTKKKKTCRCGKRNAATEKAKNDEIEKKPLSSEEKIKLARDKNAANRLLGDQLLIGRLTDEDSGSPNGSQGLSSSSTRSDFQVIKDRIKVVWGWLQCFGAMTTVFDSVPWPSGFRGFSVSTGALFSLDFSSLAGFSSCQLVIPYLDNFFVHMLFPLFLLAAIVAARLPAHLMKPKTRQMQHELMMKTVTTLLLILYPGLCTKIFGVVKCVEVEGGGGLRLAADLAVVCGQGDHLTAMVQFWIFLMLWVVGIPLFVAILLVSHRKHLFDQDSPRHKEIIHEFGSLYLQVRWGC